MSLNGIMARQLIVTADDHVYGYELLFRKFNSEGNISADREDDMLATAQVAVQALNHIGINALVEEHLAFINVDQTMLLDEIILGIPKERFILELSEDIGVDASVISRVKELKALGYTLALDNATCKSTFFETFKPIIPEITILKLDTRNIDTEEAHRYVDTFKNYTIKFLASKVETKEAYEFFKGLGCELFQGYFFAQPEIIEGKILDPAFKSIFGLINLLGKDASIEEISRNFEASPQITLQLLKFMNSGQLPLKQKIRSIAHAITLLGKDPLKHWLLLIAFARSSGTDENSFDSPLLLLAQARSKLMAEIMNRLSKDKANAHEAALVGTLSLIDVITKVPMKDVISELDMAESIELALLKHKGDLGVLLDLAIAMEEFNFDRANELLKKLDFSHEEFHEVLMASYG